MKYSNQINMFLAITGCIVVLWVLTQTYLKPPRSEQLDMAGIYLQPETPLSDQAPAVYQGEATTGSNSAGYGTSTRRPTSRRTTTAGGSAAGGGSLNSGTRNADNPSAARSPGISVSRALQSGNQGRTASSDSENISGAEGSGFPAQPTGQERPANVGGFSTPPAGQAMGMEQAKRTPADSSSDQKYVPFRSSMANRPN